MTTTPKIWKSLTQVNATDSGPDGVAQADGQIVALKDGGYVVIWADNSGAFNPNGTAVMGQRYNSVGNKVGGEVHLSTGFPGSVFRPAVTLLGDGNLAVAFVNEINGDNDIYVRIFSPSLTVGRTDFINTGATQTVDPSITALDDGGYAVSYTVDDAQIAGRTMSISGFPGPQFGASGSTHSELATLSNGNFVVVHQGAAGTIDLEVLTPNAGLAGLASAGFGSDPDVAALRDGGFVVVWTDPASSSGDIRATIFSNDTGVPNSDAFQFLVNTNTAGPQNEASVVGLADGGFLVTWENDNANLVRAQRFDAVGDKIGAEFTVKSGVSVDSPDVALLRNGKIAFAVGDVSTGDPDLMTSIYSTKTPNDFNANGISDFLWQGADGTPAVWLMNGKDAVTVGAVGSNPGPSWEVKDSGDFNGDGRADILWQGSDGTPAIWLMDGTNVLSTGAAGSFNPGPSWEVKGSGDFNGDGKDDILWQGSDGTAAIWLMNGTDAMTVGAVGSNPGPSWEIKGSGDFNGDGKDDILWQGSDGTAAIWMMNGTSVLSTGAAGSSNPGPSWEVKGSGDFNGDGKSDILWQGSDGTAALWLMNGTTAVTVTAVGSNPGPSWEIKGSGDFNGDGKSDIAWQSSDGTPAIWLMDGTNVLSTSAAGSFNPGSDWELIV